MVIMVLDDELEKTQIKSKRIENQTKCIFKIINSIQFNSNRTERQLQNVNKENS